MKRKISFMMVLVLLCTMFVVPVSAAEVSNISDEGISVAATTGTTYFSKTTTKLNSLNGLEASSLLSSGTCLGNTRNITSVTVNCRVSSGSSRYILKVTSPSGTVATKTCVQQAQHILLQNSEMKILMENGQYLLHHKVS